MRTRRIIPLLWIASVAITTLLLACGLWFGDLNQDEGWYLYSGRMVAEGKLPFIDFASTQGPLMSLVYGSAWPLVDRWGVAGGRLFTAMLGMVCMIVASSLAARLVRCRTSEREGTNAECRTRSEEWGPGIAALLCFIFLGINVYQVSFFTIVKTYALSGLLLALGFLALTYVRGRKGRTAAFLCGIFLALAAGVRLSAAFAIPIVFLVLLLSRSFQRTSLAFSFLAGSVATGCAVFLPFALKAPTAVWFGLVEYHAGRDVGGLLNVLAYKAGFIARLARAYFVSLAIMLVALVCSALREKEARGATARRIFQGFARRVLHDSPLISCLWLSVISVTLVHFLVPFPYDDYQVMVFPLFTAALAAALVEMCSGFHIPHFTFRLSGSTLLVLILLCLNAAAAFSSPIVQNWFIDKRDRIWWPLKTQTPLQGLREAADVVRSFRESDGTLLTQDTYLAIEAGCKVPEGLELGPFSYFPTWSRTRADACHVLNRESMRELLLTTHASVAAFSEYGLAIEAPAIHPLSERDQAELWHLVNERYRLWAEMKNIGQAGTRLRILVRKAPAW